MLTEGECKIAEALAQLAQLRENKDARSVPAWSTIVSMLEGFGLPTTSRPAERLGLFDEKFRKDDKLAPHTSGYPHEKTMLAFG